MPHVLIVEPDPDVRAVLRAAYRGEGIRRTTCAASAAAAAAIVQGDRPDAALVAAALDEHGDGLTLAKELIAMDIPVLIMTGSLEHQRHLIEAGCPFLSKPFGVSRLLAETRLLLDNAKGHNAVLAAILDRVLVAEPEATGTLQPP
jgi:DNA-binding response OmpR family regulator